MDLKFIEFLYPPHSGIPEFGGIYIITPPPPYSALFVQATSNHRQFLSARNVWGIVGTLIACIYRFVVATLCAASLFSTETTPRRSASCITAVRSVIIDRNEELISGFLLSADLA